MVGKTHIAEALSKKIGHPIFKMNIEKHFWDFLIHQRYATEAITQMLEQTGLSVILDRSFVSDFMYAQLFNRPYDYDTALKTDNRFANMNALIVYCYKDKEKYQDDPEDKDFISKNDYDSMKEIYEMYLSDTHCRVLKLNTSDEHLENQLSIIIQNI